MDVDISESFQTLLTGLIEFIPKLIVALITFLATLLVAGPVARAARRVAQAKIEDENALRLISRIVKWSTLIVGTLVALAQADFDVTGFVAGLGITGIAIGFALQDVAKNFVAGLLLFARQPFKIGDAVKIADFAGRVQDITTRDTVIRTRDGECVILANVDVLSNPIINYSESQLRRRTVYIGLGYGQDAEYAMDVLLEAIRSVPGVLEVPPPVLQAEALGDATINLRARFWLDTNTHNRFEVRSGVVLAVNTAAEQADIDLPYPIQTVRVVQAE